MVKYKPESVKSIVEKGYDRIAESYLEGRSIFDNTRYLRQFCKLLLPHSTILDVGCGSGKPVDVYLQRRGHAVIGIDISSKQIELARRSVPQAQYVVRDMAKLQEKEYRVDAIVSFYVLFHLPWETQKHLFKIFNTFLPEGGAMLVTLGRRNWEGVRDDYFGVPMYWSTKEPLENRAMIEDAGFHIVCDEIDHAAGEKHHVVIARKLRAVV